MHRLPLVGHAIVQFAQREQRRTGARRHIGTESGRGFGFLEDPRELRPPRVRDAVQHHGPPEIEPRPDARDILRRSGAELFEEQGFDVSRANAAGRQLVTISRLGQERLAPEPGRGKFGRLFERQVLERVQRVVVDEDADRPLRRQQERELIDHGRQRMVW